MTAKPGPIVITLKKRLGPAKRVDEDEDDSALGAAGDAGVISTGGLGRSSLGGTISRSRSRRSNRHSPSPLSPLRAPAIAPSSVLNVAALEDIFARFHGHLDTWLQAESSKLERAEARGNGARDNLRQCADRVCDFLRDHAPRAYADLGPDPAGDGFTSRALPQFLDTINEDRRALQEAVGVLTAFVDRRFPKNEELASLKADASPLPLLRAILRLLASQPKAASHRVRPEGEEP